MTKCHLYNTCLSSFINCATCILYQTYVMICVQLRRLKERRQYSHDLAFYIKQVEK